jgi:hypothetical protein
MFKLVKFRNGFLLKSQMSVLKILQVHSLRLLDIYEINVKYVTHNASEEF